MEDTVTTLSSFASPSDHEGLDVSSSDYEEGAGTLAPSNVHQGRSTPKGGRVMREADSTSRRRVAVGASAPGAETASTTLRRVSGDYSSRMAEANTRTAAMARYKLMVQAARLVPTPQKTTAACGEVQRAGAAFTTTPSQPEEAAEAESEPAFPVSTEVSDDSSSSSDDDDDQDGGSNSGSSVDVSAIQPGRDGPLPGSATSLPQKATRESGEARSTSARPSQASSSSQSAASRAAQAAACALRGRPQTEAPAATSRVATAPVMIRKRRPSDVDRELAEVAALAEAAATTPIATKMTKKDNAASADILAPSSSSASAKPSAVAAAAAAVAAKRAATARALAELEAAEKARTQLDTKAPSYPVKTQATPHATSPRASTGLSQVPAAPQRHTEGERADTDDASSDAMVLSLPDGPVLPRSHLADSAGVFEPNYVPMYGRTPRGDAEARFSHRLSTHATAAPSEAAVATAEPAPSARASAASGSRSARERHAATSENHTDKAPGAAAEKTRKSATVISTGGGGAFWVRPASALYEMTASIAAKHADVPRPSEKAPASARGRRSHDAVPHHAAPETTHKPATTEPVLSARRRSERHSGTSAAPAAGDDSKTLTEESVLDAPAPSARCSTRHRHGPRPSSATAAAPSALSSSAASRGASDDANCTLTASSASAASASASSSPSKGITRRRKRTASGAPHARPSRGGVSSVEASKKVRGTTPASETASNSSASRPGSVFERLSSTNNSGLRSAAVVVPSSARGSTSSPSAATTSATSNSSASQMPKRQQESFQRHCSRLSSLRAANEAAEKAAAAKDEHFRTTKTRQRVASRQSAGGRVHGSALCPSTDVVTPPLSSRASTGSHAVRLSGTVSKQLLFDEEADTAAVPTTRPLTKSHRTAAEPCRDEEEEEPCPLSKAPRATARRDSGASLLDFTPPKSRRREDDKTASPARPDDDEEKDSLARKNAHTRSSQAHRVDPVVVAEAPSDASSTQDRIAALRSQYGLNSASSSTVSARPSVSGAAPRPSVAGLPPMPRPSVAAADALVGTLQSAAYQRRCVLPCFLCGEAQSVHAYTVHTNLCLAKTRTLLEARGDMARDDVQAALNGMTQRAVPTSADDAFRAEREAFVSEAYQCARTLLVPCQKCGSKLRVQDAKEHELLCGRAHYEKSKAAERVRDMVQSIESAASASSSS